MIKFCKHHGETAHRIEKCRGKNDKHRCCKCQSEAVSRRRNKVKQMALEYKGGKCNTCGYSKCKEALEFYHLDPNEKEFAISYKGETRSWERTRKELDKCILLCANCHREIHFLENIDIP